jgi:16S rRNA (cytosine1402-N4)-methyltransferase
MGAEPMHQPVMLHEVVNALAPRAGDFVIDCTFGRGGHSRAILKSIGQDGRLLALDKDPAALASKEAQELLNDPRFSIVPGSFGQLHRLIDPLLRNRGVSGMLMDLGVSSPQLEDPERGFSFLRNGPLDMRMNPREGPTAAEWLMQVSASELFRVLRDYGEERYASRIARAIIDQRSRKPLTMTKDLVELIEQASPTREKSKHPATRSFQAIRIAVNRELEELELALPQAVDILRPGGRMVVIAFHSLEDRIVKRFMRDQEKGHTPLPLLPFQSIQKRSLRRIGKAIKPGEEEILENPRARSAILRVAERLTE